MRAAVVDRYGPPEVVTVREVPTPAVGKGEVLVRVEATAVTAGDARLRAARFPRGFGLLARLGFGVTRPRRHILGSCLSGVVEAVGEGVSDLAVGDEVCGMTGSRMAAHAELAAVEAARLVRKPEGVTHDEAAGVLFGGTTARQFLHVKSTVSRGERVLVVGASGAVGSMAVQLAVLAGAEVTAVTSAPNAELARDLGASQVIDYRTTDITDLTAVGGPFDLVVETVGTLTKKTGRPLLAPGGVLLLVAGDLLALLTARGNVRAGVAGEDTADMTALLDLVAADSLRVPLDRVLPMDGIVEAHARVDSGRKVGNVVVHPGQRRGESQAPGAAEEASA